MTFAKQIKLTKRTVDVLMDQFEGKFKERDRLLGDLMEKLTEESNYHFYPVN